MTNTEIMEKAIMDFFNTESGQKMVKKVRDQAIAEGRVKTEAEWQEMKKQMIIFMVAKNPELIKIIARDFWNKVNAA